MFKNITMKTLIISIVTISTGIGILLLCILAYNNQNKVLEEKINEKDDNTTKFVVVKRTQEIPAQ